MTKIIVGLMLGIVIVYTVTAFIFMGGFPAMYTELVTAFKTSGFQAEESFWNFSMLFGLLLGICMECLMWYEIVLNT